MNEVMQTILTRRSVRSFKNQPIEEEKLDAILQAAIYAPSGMNRQTWQFTAITNKEKIKELAQIIEQVLDRKGYNLFEPAAIIITSNEKESKWAKEDNACALENMFIAAQSMGIGSVWINQLLEICDEQRVREYLTEVGIPENHGVYGIGAFGYPAITPVLKSEKKGKIHRVK